MKVFLATNNQGKVERFKHLLLQVDPTIEVHTPSSLGIASMDVVEDGKTLAENAEKKVLAYKGLVDMPILSNDAGFFSEKEGFVDAPKRVALQGDDEHDLSQEEITKRLVEYWKAVATRNGGELDAAWLETFAVLMPDGTVRKADSRREIILTDKEFGPAHFQLPMRALYISKATGKPAIQHTEEEEIYEMQPVIEALKNVLIHG